MKLVQSNSPLNPQDRFSRGRWRVWDGISAIVLMLLVLHALAGSAFHRLEWVDWICYALPAANLIERGTLATPQLGQQLGLDRYWLWNSPLMAAGPLPFFAIGGVGRISYLLGLTLALIVVLFVITLSLRRALGLNSLALAVIAGYALLGTRSFYAELGNQRYSILAIAALAGLFTPRRPDPGRDPWFRWLLAGALPLIHPSLLIASIIWVVGEAVRWIGEKQRAERIVLPRLGLTLFLLAVGACALWYLRPEPFRLQFLPQTDAIAVRSGLLLPFHSKLTSSPTYATYILVVISGIAALVGARRLSARMWGIRRAGFAVLFVLSVELTRGFFYLPTYLIGLAPPVLAAWRPTRIRQHVTVALVALSLMHAVVALHIGLRFDLFSYPITSATLEQEFILRNTRPGDAIVLGPPLILASSRVNWPGARSVRFVVPQPWFANELDDRTFRRAIRDQSTVYIGEVKSFNCTDARVYFSAKSPRDPGCAPLFPSAEVRTEILYGIPILIARRSASGTPASGEPRSRQEE